MILFSCALLAAVAGAQSWEKFSSFQNVGGKADETARQIVMAADGSLFTLSTSGSGLVVAKRDATGTPQWHAYFPATPSGLALAPDGGVAVISRLDRGKVPGVKDMAVLRYDAAGNFQWWKSIGACTGLPDPNLRDVIDASGNIYIGGTVNQDAFSDIQIQKLDPNGNNLWTKTLGPDPNQEVCLGIQLDPAGNLLAYVTRNSSSAVIYKFDANGNQLWTFTPTVSGAPTGFAMDSTGATYLALNGTPAAVVKATSAGAQAWKTSLPSTNVALGLGLLGTNAYVCGAQPSTGNSFVSKIGANGGISWTATHTPADSQPESLNSVAVAADGSVYASGDRAESGSATIFTFKVGSTGTAAWALDDGSYVYTPPLIPPVIPTPPPIIPTTTLVDSSSRPITYSTINGPGSVTGYDNLIAINSTVGTLATSNLDDLNGTADFADTCVTDPAGNTYVLANSEQGGGADVIVQQFHPDGTLGWLKGAGGPGPDLGYALAVVPGGGLDMSYGMFNPTKNLWDTYVRRYDASGNQVWAAGPLDGSVHVSAMAEGSDGSCYLVGQDQAAPPFRFHVAKISSAGAVAWSTLFPGIGNQDDYPFKIALDSSSNVYVAGNLWDGSKYLSTLQKYNPSTGAVVFTKTYSSTGSGAAAFSLLLDGQGNIYVGGADWANGARGLIRKYDTSGNVKGTFISAEPDTVGERYMAMALDSAGNLVVGGSGVLSNKHIDLLAAKYTSSGSLIWKRLFDGPTGMFDQGMFLAVDPFGGIYVAGNAALANNRQYILWRLNSDGSNSWPDSGDVFTNGAVFFDSGQKLANTLSGLSMDSAGNAYIAGSAVGPNNTYDIHAMKFGSTNQLNSQLVSQSVPSAMAAGQSYTVSYVFSNASTVAWTAAAGFSLGSVNPAGNTTWGLNRRSFASTDTINPGSQAKFSFLVYAPTIAGTYNLQWSMQQDSVGPFGQPSTNVPVVVSVAPNAARYVSQSVPSSIRVTTSFTVKVTMTNVGSNTWTQTGGYAIAPSGGTSNFGVTSVSVGSTSVAPGQSRTFTIQCVAPSTPGSYVIRFQMRNASGFFGDRTTSKTITVTST